MDLENCKSKEIYRALVNSKCDTPTGLLKYCDTYEDLSNVKTDNIYMIPRLCCKDNEIKEFQFKILHRYLPTNSLLYKMRKVISYKCTFCHLQEETILHLLYECMCVRNLWFRVQDILDRVKSTNIKLTSFDVLFGFNMCDTNEYVINNVILHIKFYIWKSKSKFIAPNYEDMKRFMNKRKLYDSKLLDFCNNM